MNNIMNDIKNEKKNKNKDLYNKKVENYELELIEYNKKYKNDFPLTLTKQIEKFFNYDVELINDYNNKKKEFKKKITTLKYNIKYNKNADIRIKKTDIKNVKIDYIENVLNEKINEKIELENVILKKDEIINNKDDIIFEQQKLIKDDKKTIFNLNILCKDLQYEIKNLKESYKYTNNNSDKISSNSSSSSSSNKKININYSEIKELSDFKLNKFLCAMGYKYNDIKEISFHEKKQLFNKNNNDKINRLFNK